MSGEAPEPSAEDIVARVERLRAARATRSPFGARERGPYLPSAEAVREARELLAEVDARRRAANLARAARGYRERRGRA